jgi:N-methylhydantoinase A
VHTTEVLLQGEITDAALDAIAEDFHAAYEREYTYRLDAPVEMVGIHLAARAEVGRLAMITAEAGPADAAPALMGRRPVDYALEGRHEAHIHDGDLLAPGMEFEGPAIVEDAGTTIVIHPGNRVEIDAFRNIHIHLEGRS